MATAVKDIIARALRIDGVLGTAQALDPNEANDALKVLNQMLEQWSLEDLNCYQHTTNQYNTVAGTSSYTIGTGGNWVTGGRPIDLALAFVRISNVDYPMEIITNKAYQELAQKTVQGQPEKLYYQPEYPLGKIFLYPTPDAVYSIGLSQLLKFSSFSDISAEVSLPPGYESALAWNLAVELSAEYGKQIDAVTMKKALETKANIKRKNNKKDEMNLESRFLGTSVDTFNITLGY